MSPTVKSKEACADKFRNLNTPTSAPPLGRAPKACVLSRNDWTRIEEQLKAKTLQKSAIQKEIEDREKLRDKSRELVKTWTNTLEAARERRLKERSIREEVLEKERKKIDIEEARLAAEKRKECIMRAKQQIYYEGDRVKEFHSALRFTEVLKEREAQLELKRVKNLSNIGNDSEWQKMAQQELERMEEDERLKNESQRTQAINTKIYNKNQIAHRMAEREADKQADWKEGMELQELAQKHCEEQALLNKVKNEKKLFWRAETQRQIEDKERFRQMEQLVEEKEDDESRLFADAKRKVMRMRAQKEADFKRQKQETLDKIKTKLFAQQKALKDDEDHRIGMAVVEREAAMDEEDERKKKAREDAIKEQARHRAEQKQKREQLMIEEAALEKHLVDLQLEKDAQTMQKEAEKVAARRARARQLAMENSRNDADRQAAESHERMLEIVRENRNVKQMWDEEARFKEYAGRVIEHMESKNRNTCELRRVANRPLVELGELPNANSQFVTEGEAIKLQNTRGNTHKRLGMTWQPMV